MSSNLSSVLSWHNASFGRQQLSTYAQVLSQGPPGTVTQQHIPEFCSQMAGVSQLYLGTVTI